MKGSSLACVAVCVLALSSGGAFAAGLIIAPVHHVAIAHRPPPPMNGPHPGYAHFGAGFPGGAHFANPYGIGWRFNSPHGQGARNAWNSGSSLGDSGGIYIPQAQPTAEASWAPATALIIDVSTYNSGTGGSQPSGPSSGGAKIIYINRDAAAKPPAGDGPKVIYGEIPAGSAPGPRIIYGDSPN